MKEKTFVIPISELAAYRDAIEAHYAIGDLVVGNYSQPTPEKRASWDRVVGAAQRLAEAVDAAERDTWIEVRVVPVHRTRAPKTSARRQ